MLRVERYSSPHWAERVVNRFRDWRKSPPLPSKYPVGSIHWAVRDPGGTFLSETFENGTFLWHGQEFPFVYMAKVIHVEDHRNPHGGIEPHFKYRIQPASCDPVGFGWETVYEEWLYSSKREADEVFQACLRREVRHYRGVSATALHRVDRLQTLLKEPEC